MWGDSGRDDFIGEPLELRDFDAPAGERLTPALASERSNIPPEGPPVDAGIAIADPRLRVAIAEALGYAVTQSYIPGEYLIHVPEGSARTDLPLTNAANFRERILASDLGELTVLDASGLGISDLTGLKYAINLTTLNLADNAIGDGNLDQLIPATQSSGDTRGFQTGMRRLENLLLDFNPLTDLDPLAFLGDLERLSIDGLTTKDLLAQVPKLFWMEVGGVERGLQYLSLDYVGARASGAPIDSLEALAGQTDLRFVSLKGNLIEDVRPLMQLDSLEVARLDDNLIASIEDLAGTRVVDNGDPGYRSSGWLQNLNPTGAAFEGDYQFRYGSDDDSQAIWTFTRLDPGVYQVLLSYVPAATASDDVTVVVKGADTAAVAEGLPLFASLPGTATAVPAGGNTVTIDTDAVGSDDLIVGDDADPGTFYGTPFSASVVGGLTEVVVYGDLIVPGDTIKVIGSRPLSLVVANDVLIDSGAMFDLSAVGTTAG